METFTGSYHPALSSRQKGYFPVGGCKTSTKLSTMGHLRMWVVLVALVVLMAIHGCNTQFAARNSSFLIPSLAIQQKGMPMVQVLSCGCHHVNPSLSVWFNVFGVKNLYKRDIHQSFAFSWTEERWDQVYSKVEIGARMLPVPLPVLSL